MMVCLGEKMLMIRFRQIALALIVALGLISAADYSVAAPSDVRAAKEQFRKIKREQKQLAKLARKLSKLELQRFKRSVRGTDSDGDGVPDIIEDSRKSNKCDEDSDDDGIDDDEDYKEGDDDSDDDGIVDGREFEREGAVQSFSDPSVVIGGTTYILTEATQFLYKFGEFTRADLTTGLCVEVEGYVNDESPSSNIVQKIKRKKDSSCSGSDDDDDDDDDDGDDD